MYAIVDIAGQQFKIENGQKIYVHRLEDEEGQSVNFDKVLLIDNEGKILIGEPVIEGAYVEGKVLSHMKSDKVIVFKKKRRKGYKVKNGHRQLMSHIEIVSINETGAPKKSAVKPETRPKAEKASAIEAEAPKVATGKEQVSKTEKAEPQAKAAKKPAVKSSSTAKAPSAAKKKTEPVKAETKSTAASKSAKAGTKTTAKKPAAKKPAAKKPVAKKPAAKKPAAKPKAKPGAGKKKK